MTSRARHRRDLCVGASRRAAGPGARHRWRHLRLPLAQVGEDETRRRIAVGDHLMLGGDNMDAAIARKAEEQITSGGRKLTSTQWNELVQASRGEGIIACAGCAGELSPVGRG